jgi:hypothetical protein
VKNIIRIWTINRIMVNRIDERTRTSLLVSTNRDARDPTSELSPARDLTLRISARLQRDASDGTVEALQKIVPAIRQRFGDKVRIIVRADSGFARDVIMAWCQDNAVFYCFGLAVTIGSGAAQIKL